MFSLKALRQRDLDFALWRSLRLQFRVEVLTTLPVQVDGEAWPQPPGYITVQCLPQQAAMLRGPESKHYSRSMTKKEVVKTMEVGHVKER